MKFLASALFLASIVAFTALAQKPAVTPPVEDDDVVKISTKLVQLDAVVLDKKGNPVNDLTAEDFEILQDGKPQKITNFSFISRTSVTEVSEQTVKEKTSDKKSKIPPVSFRPKDKGRVITFVVDDGNGSSTFAGIFAIRDGLTTFVNDQMQPNDLVAIYQTRDGSSRLHQYTSDKEKLLQIIKKIRWYPAGGARSNITGEAAAKQSSEFKVNGQPTETEQEKLQREQQMNSARFEDKTKQADFSDFTMERQAVGVLGLLRYVIKGLYPVSGRKVLFLFSESLTNDDPRVGSLIKKLKEVASLANRASIV